MSEFNKDCPVCMAQHDHEIAELRQKVSVLQERQREADKMGYPQPGGRCPSAFEAAIASTRRRIESVRARVVARGSI